MKSVKLRAKELRAIYQLVGQCRELGDDALVWREHLCAGVSRLVSADIVGGGEMSGAHFGEPQLLGNIDWGWEAGFNRQGWINSVKFFRENPFHQPALKAALDHLRTRKAVTLPRPRLANDDEWYGCENFDAIHGLAGIDALIYSFRYLPGTQDDFNALFTHREIGQREFNERERRLVAYLQRELVPLIGGPLARFKEPSPSELAPRVRAVLKCLLEGDADKQIAARLSLSPYTVNQYTKTIYRHFGVGGRAELLSRWVRRGWNARCEWLATDED